MKDREFESSLTTTERMAFYGLNDAMLLAHSTARAAGWYTDPTTNQPVSRNFGEVIALMHSELSEALEADRKGRTSDEHLPHLDPRAVEFADCIIRIMDTASALGLDVPRAVIEKNRYNMQRNDHKVTARRGVGGKRY